MAKTYLPGSKGAVFKNVIRFSDATPLDGRVVVDSYIDIAGEAYKTLFSEDGVQTWYVGMLVVTKDTGKLYVLVEKTKVENDITVNYAEFDEVTPDLSNIHGSITAETLDAAKALATANNIGQVIYIPTKTDESGEVINANEAGAYIVAGAGVVSKLATTTASGDLVADVTTLQGDVSDLKTDVENLKKFDHSVYATKSDWKVKDVATDDNVLSLDSNGILSSSLRYERANIKDAEGKDVDSLVLYGKNNTILGSIAVADFVANGILKKVTHDDTANTLTFEFTAESGEQTVTVDLSKYLDFEPYTQGTGISISNENVISIDDTYTTTLLSPYAKTNDVNKTLEDYAKTSDVNKTLEDYAKTDDVVSNEVFNPWKTKLEGIEAGAQVNKIEDIVRGTDESGNPISLVNENKVVDLSSLLHEDDVVALNNTEIDSILNPKTEPEATE